MSSLWKAMLEAQKEIEHSTKDSVNPHMKNRYASLKSVLDSVIPVLNKHGLVLTQEIRHGNNEPGSVRLTTRIIHAASGEQTQDAQVIPLVKVDPQGHGSAITYARRYAIQAMTGTTAEEDDDGNEASAKPAGLKIVKPEEKPADPAKVEAVTKSLSTALGFKKGS